MTNFRAHMDIGAEGI